MDPPTTPRTPVQGSLSPGASKADTSADASACLVPREVFSVSFAGGFGSSGGGGERNGGNGNNDGSTGADFSFAGGERLAVLGRVEHPHDSPLLGQLGARSGSRGNNDVGGPAPPTPPPPPPPPPSSSPPPPPSSDLQILAYCYPDLGEAELATALDLAGGVLDEAVYLLAEVAADMLEEQQQQEKQEQRQRRASSPGPPAPPAPADLALPATRAARATTPEAPVPVTLPSIAPGGGAGDGGGGEGAAGRRYQPRPPPPAPEPGRPRPSFNAPAASAPRTAYQGLFAEGQAQRRHAQSLVQRANRPTTPERERQRLLEESGAASGRARDLIRQARRLALEELNADAFNENTVDVHGQDVAEATHRVLGMLVGAQGMADATRRASVLRVITGKGLHSGPGGPVLRPAVMELLGRYGAALEWRNSGVVVATVRPAARSL